MLNIAVIIPFYNVTLSSNEIISLTQARRILSNFTIKFISPQKNKPLFEIYKSFTKNDDVLFFDDKYFTSKYSYSRLLVNVKFYEYFESFDFILIHQLDAFVFRNCLVNFAELGYDYIGAPWPRWIVKRYAYSSNGNLVGNGGLSLRNVKNTIAVLKKAQSHLKIIINEHSQDFAEDLFFCDT